MSTNCTDCGSSNIVLTGSYFPGSPCVDTDCGGTSISALCVYYNGSNLECSGIETLDPLEVALQKIDEQICAITGDYSTYNMHCLPDWWEEAITTQEEFVDAITDYVCDLYDTVDTFISTTYVADQTALDVRLDALEVPGITCASASVTSTDTLQQVLTKYCTKFASLTTAISISSVDWDGCLTVVSPPTTIAGGFQLLSDQLCELYALLDEGGILPIFNNYGTCIGGTSADSLVTTIGLIKTRLCLTPLFDVDNVDFGCVEQNSEFDIIDLETSIQAIVDQLDVLLPAAPTFDEGDFTITANDVSNPCAGITVSLATPEVQDRFVAVNADDEEPGTLITKLTSGGSILFDDSTDTELSIDIAGGDYGDITVAVGGLTWTIDNDAVTFAKMQNINTAKLLGRTTASSGNVEEIAVGGNLVLSTGTLNTYGRTLISVNYYSSSGTWTKPTGCTAVQVLTVGAGGGGGGALGASGQTAVGAGGGSGAHSINFITSGLGATEVVTVGAGGAGGSSGNSYVGQQGASSSFGSHITVGGGYGGGTLATGTSVIGVTGGSGGDNPTISGTTLQASCGEDAAYGARLSASTYMMSKGGNSFVGSSNFGGPSISGKGAGGYGNIEYNAAAGQSGLAGSGGLVVVYSYS